MSVVQFSTRNGIEIYLGPVVQSNVSLTILLSKSFVKCLRKYYHSIPICCVAECKVLFALLQLHTVFQ